MLNAWGICGEPRLENIAGASFLTFSSEELPGKAWEAISSHSAVCFAASREGGLLRPIPLQRQDYLSDDIAEVLKYKGKTNANFTTMVLHCARCASDFARWDEPLTILDPICGRGTSLFCAMQEGHNAIGVEIDAKALAELDAYFVRYLKYHKMKHRRETASATLPHARSAKEIRYVFTGMPQPHGQAQTLRLFSGDTKDVRSMVGGKNCHLIIGDLPYGVQHAPKEKGGLSSLEQLLKSALPEYARVLKPGGALALAFNTFTLPRETVARQMRAAGFTVMEQQPYDDFSHWVEQAVNRDFVVARLEK